MGMFVNVKGWIIMSNPGDKKAFTISQVNDKISEKYALTVINSPIPPV